MIDERILSSSPELLPFPGIPTLPLHLRMRSPLSTSSWVSAGSGLISGFYTSYFSRDIRRDFFLLSVVLGDFVR
ncbi:hypothetical protein CEXT_811731 [Caerostris extrusa]|uniref:Uncharacterized protein n=1 Tax=Caerostris extrusa TaxID=172846 RepID=A0AAV4TY26_CAEEX|nr:hypothetical protein CEXT_811731 [Caerostris extrusa]